MILQALYALYDRLAADPAYDIAPPGYSLQKITFRIVLNPDGTLHSIQDTRITDEKGRPRPRQLLVPGDTKPSGSGLNPGFLWDNTAYMLGFKAEDDNPSRTRASFEAFRKKHVDLRPHIDSRAFSAVCRFLESWNPEQAGQFPVLTDAGATGFGVFQILGRTEYVHEDPTVKQWWSEHAQSDPDAPRGYCLVSNEFAPIARIHKKIRGVSGGKAEMSLVSFNEAAYESYGKEQSFNAPVSENAAFRYATALSAILDGPQKHKHRIQIGEATVAFWTEQPTETENIFARFLAEGDALLSPRRGVQDEALRRKIETFLRALKKGKQGLADFETAPESVRFYILGLSPNSARLALRFFYQGTLGELIENLHRHFQHIAVRPPAYAAAHAFPSIARLLQETARDPKEVPPILSGPLLRAVIAGTRYPEGLFAAVIRRIRAGDDVSHAKCCVIKGYLVRNRGKEIPMSLDPNRTDPPYLLGRLFAVFEKTQRDALGEKINATIRDRFYSAASATPGAVFPRLLRTYQHHLAKLEGGRKVNREKLVQEIMASLTAFPARLDLPDQGLFAIGYYHQMQDFYTKKEEEN